MCDVYAKPSQEMNLGEIEKVFTGLKRTGMMVVEITGGEPFLRKDIVDVLTLLDEMGFLLTITTNGTLLSGPVAEKLNHLKGLVQLAVSLDSLDRELYAKLCGVDMLPVVLRNLGSLSSATLSFPVKINFTLSRMNYKETFAMLDFVKERGLFLSVFPVTWGSGFHHRGDDQSLCPTDAERQEMAQIFRALRRFRKTGEPLWEYSRFYDLAADYVTGKPVGVCDAGSLYLDLRPDGTIAACIDQEGLGNLLQEDISALLLRIPSEHDRIAKCSACTPCCYTCTFNLSITAEHLVDFVIETLRIRARHWIARRSLSPRRSRG